MYILQALLCNKLQTGPACDRKVVSKRFAQIDFPIVATWSLNIDAAPSESTDGRRSFPRPRHEPSQMCKVPDDPTNDDSPTLYQATHQLGYQEADWQHKLLLFLAPNALVLS